MSVYEYTPLVFVDGTAPAISAENLNHGEQAIVRSSFRAGGTFTGTATTDAAFTQKSTVFSGWTYFGGAADSGTYNIKNGTSGFYVPDGFAVALVWLNVKFDTYTADASKIELIHDRSGTKTVIDSDGADSAITNPIMHCSAFVPVAAGDVFYPYVYGKEAQSNAVVMQIILL